MNASSFLDHISKVAPPPSTTSPILEPADSAQQIGLCMAGTHLLHQPLEITCGHHICAQCLWSKAKSAHTLHCTSCDATHPLAPESATSPSALLLDLIAEQLTKCRACGEKCEGQTPGPTPLKFLYRPCQRQCEECAYEAPFRATEPLRGEGGIQFGEEKISASRTSTITLKTGGPVREHMHSHAHKMSLQLFTPCSPCA